MAGKCVNSKCVIDIDHSKRVRIFIITSEASTIKFFICVIKLPLCNIFVVGPVFIL